MRGTMETGRAFEKEAGKPSEAIMASSCSICLYASGRPLYLCAAPRMVSSRSQDISVWPAADRLDALTTLTLNGARVDLEPLDALVEELEELAAGGEPETGAAEGLAALKVIVDAIA